VAEHASRREDQSQQDSLHRVAIAALRTLKIKCTCLKDLRSIAHLFTFKVGFAE
jgi:hypothetical protein